MGTTYEPYKGVRDFYPEDERVQQYMFSKMRKAVESFGYEQMNASVLESTELYLAKTSEEIVKEQTYTFLDRGNRSVTLRPEMTPTVARMVAAKKRELGFPLRWYSIQNFFRYERPQRGRLREFWQLNADLFGVPHIEGDVEAIHLAYRIMKELGADDSMFTIRISSRAFINHVYDSLDIPTEERPSLTRALDAKDKGAEVPKDILDALTKAELFPYFMELKKMLDARGIPNAVIDAQIARGFDYYTGLVFEVFDTDKENSRSLFGGGRYDNLIGQYGSESVPAVGFAMGDVGARNFLETHNLLPRLFSHTHVYLAPVTSHHTEEIQAFASFLRERGVHVAVGMKHEKIGDHIKAAQKLAIPFFIAYGENEIKSESVTLKHIETGKEQVVKKAEIEHVLV